MSRCRRTWTKSSSSCGTERRAQRSEAAGLQWRFRMLIRFAKAAGATLLILATLTFWYSVAANYDYDSLAGTYVLKQGTEECTLFLRPDRTFIQEINRSGSHQTVQGRWRRLGQAGVSFSDEFIPLSGEELNESQEAHGQFNKRFGLFPSLTFAPLPDGPALRRKLFNRL